MATAYFQGSDGQYYEWTPQMIGSASSNGLVQASAVTLPAGSNILDFASKHQSFAGSVQTNDGAWFNLLSIRHRNNTSDGPNYGMVLYTPLTSTAGSLTWRQQFGSKPEGGVGETKEL